VHKRFSRSGLRTLVRRWILGALPVLVLLGVAPVPAAQAATVGYTMQAGSGISATGLKLDDDELVALSVPVTPTVCTGGHSISGDDSFDISLAAPVALHGGRFELSGRAPSSYYATGANPSGYGADYAVSGTVTPDHRMITGTVSITNASDPFVAGCSGGYSFTAIPTVKQPPWGSPHTPSSPASSSASTTATAWSPT
jgi:hypothetical protein